jgi:hypothetical protein
MDICFKERNIVMNKPIKILDRALFSGSLRELTVKDIVMEVGKLSSGKFGIATVKLDSDDPKYHEKLNWVTNNNAYISLAIDLPDDVAAIWLTAYDNATIDGHNGDDAAQLAWAAVAKEYIKDKSGRWVRLSDEWKPEITKQLTPTIEVMRTGKYRDSVGDEISITETMLDEMVKNFEAGGYSPPITNDHRQDGPSFGKVDKLFRVGKSLFATLSNLVPKFIEKVRSGEYLHRSAEFWSNFIDGDGKEYGARFKAITFLGVKTPAIKDMAMPQFSEFGTSYGLSIDKNDFCIKLTELKPLNTEGDIGLNLPKSQEELDAIVKLAEGKAVDAAIKDKDKAHQDDIKKLSDENLALKKQIDDQKVKQAETEAQRNSKKRF